MRYLVVPFLAESDNPHVSPEDVEGGAKETCVEILKPRQFFEAYEVEDFIQKLMLREKLVLQGLDWTVWENVDGNFVQRSITFASIQ